MAILSLYSTNKVDLGMRDLLTASVKLALLSNSYVPNITTSGHTIWSDVSAHEIAAGNGYTQGGAELTLTALTASTVGYSFSSESVTWNSVGAGIPEHYYYVLYVNGVLWNKNSPLIGYFLGNSEIAGVPVTPPGSPLSVTPWAGGWFDVA